MSMIQSTHPAQAHVIAAFLQVQTLQQLLYSLQKAHTRLFLFKCGHLQVKLEDNLSSELIL